MNQAASTLPLLVAADLSATLGGRTVVTGITLHVWAGEVIALVGPNGAGKSTLLSLLAGDLLPASGTIMLDGKPLTMLSAQQQAQRRAVLRQQVGLGFAFTALEVALMGRHPHLRGHAEGPRDVALARDALARTEMLVHAERIVPTLSGGEQARVQLARVLAQQAPLLLLDEPTAALDLRHQHTALRLARAVADEGGAAVVVLHDLNLAALYADRIGLMHAGRLLALDCPWAVLRADQLETVYQVPITVQRHPQCDAPLVLALPFSYSGATHEAA
jgi:iron complex transport system ATP-binding protein